MNGSIIPLGNMSPLNDVVSRSPFSLPGLAGAVSPAFKVPLELGTGIDLSHYRIGTRPPGVPGRDEHGNLKLSTILDPAAVGNILVNQVPIARGLRSVVQGDAGRYGGTGQIIRDNRTGQPTFPGDSRVNALLKTFFPIPRAYTPEGEVKPKTSTSSNPWAVRNG